MVVATSLNKAFACAGGVLLFKNNIWKERVRNCGGTLMFSGPIQPPMLGAAVESAKVHLSLQISKLQTKLQDNIEFCNNIIKEKSLPLVVENNSPIFFIACGLPSTTYEIINGIMNDGYYVNPGVFPAVAIKRGGIRFTLTSQHSHEEIRGLINSINKNFIKVFSNGHVSYSDMIDNFSNFNLKKELVFQGSIMQLEYSVEIHNSIHDVDREVWDTYMSDNGVDSYNGLVHQEKVFSGDTISENNWMFYYILIKDKRNKIVCLSYFTIAICKADMLSPINVSKKIETLRSNDKYFLSNRTLMVGSLVSEKGIYIDINNKEISKILNVLIENIESISKEENISSIILKNICDIDNEEFIDNMLKLGYIKIDLPKTHYINNFGWKTDEEFISSIRNKYRNNFRKEIYKLKDNFYTSFSKKISETEMKYLYQLYLNVKAKNFEINTYNLPFEYFKSMIENPYWDIMRIYLKNVDIENPVAVMFSYIDGKTYSAKFIGLNYDFVKSHKSYKQSLYLTLLRAKELGYSPLSLGLTATIEKKKLGAKVKEQIGFIQFEDHFNIDEILTRF